MSADGGKDVPVGQHEASSHSNQRADAGRLVSPDLEVGARREGGWGTGMGAGGATADKAYNMYTRGGLGGARPLGRALGPGHTLAWFTQLKVRGQRVEIWCAWKQLVWGCLARNRACRIRQ